MTTYAFILGRVYTLSLAELLEVFKSLGYAYSVRNLSSEVAVFDFANELPSPAELQARLGGTIKIIKILDNVKKKPQDFVDYSLKEIFSPISPKYNFLDMPDGKLTIGISLYKLDEKCSIVGQATRVALNFKRELQAQGRNSVRVVLPQSPASSLSSVVVKHNNLLHKGGELCILVGQREVLVGHTLTFQDFEDYGRRDFARPVRDEKRGMLPPKLAQIMLNLANLKPSQVVYDPFCGLGTVLQESLLLGFRPIGSDIDPKAIAGLRKNMSWFCDQYMLSGFRLEAGILPVEKSQEYIASLKAERKLGHVNAIVSEGTLGPMYTRLPSANEMEKNFDMLKKLYTGGFESFSAFLSRGARVVICLPAYKRAENQYLQLPSLDFIGTLGYNLTNVISAETFENRPFLKVTARGTILYDRKDQVVAREVAVFKKIN